MVHEGHGQEDRLATWIKSPFWQLGYNIISTFHGNYVKFNIDFARKKNIYLTQIICNILGVGEGHNTIPVFKMALREDTHKKSVFLVVSDH